MARIKLKASVKLCLGTQTPFPVCVAPLRPTEIITRAQNSGDFLPFRINVYVCTQWWLLKGALAPWFCTFTGPFTGKSWSVTSTSRKSEDINK